MGVNVDIRLNAIHWARAAYPVECRRQTDITEAVRQLKMMP